MMMIVVELKTLLGPSSNAGETKCPTSELKGSFALKGLLGVQSTGLDVHLSLLTVAWFVRETVLLETVIVRSGVCRKKLGFNTFIIGRLGQVTRKKKNIE